MSPYYIGRFRDLATILLGPLGTAVSEPGIGERT